MPHFGNTFRTFLRLLMPHSTLKIKAKKRFTKRVSGESLRLPSEVVEKKIWTSELKASWAAIIDLLMNFSKFDEKDEIRFWNDQKWKG